MVKIKKQVNLSFRVVYYSPGRKPTSIIGLLLRIYFLTIKPSLNFSISYRGNSGSFKQEPESKNNFINNYGDETGRYNHLLRFRKYNDSKLAYHQQQGRKYTPASYQFWNVP